MKAKFLIPILLCMVLLVPQVSAFQWCEWIPFWDCNDPIQLIDHTVYNEQTNTCSGSRGGMQVDVYPCEVQDLDGKDITQYVDFTWEGNVQKQVGWVFMYEGELENGKIELLKNVSVDYNETQQENAYGSLTLYNVVDFTNLGTPDNRCEYGNTENTRMWQIEKDNGTLEVYCFTTFNQLSATTLQISGNYYRDIIVTNQRIEQRWVDVSNALEFLGKNLNNNGYSYYRVSNTVFNPDEQKRTKWTYTPNRNYRNGKWSILGYESETGLMNAIENGQYLFIDPWWDNDWLYKKEISLNSASSTNLTNFPITFKVNTQELIMEGKMNDDCSDLRVVDSDDTTELTYEIETNSCNTTTTRIYALKPIFIEQSTNDTVYMYYGNTGASDNQNSSGVWINGYSYIMHFANETDTLAGVTWTNNGGSSFTTIDGERVANFTSSFNQYLSITGTTHYRWTTDTSVFIKWRPYTSGQTIMSVNAALTGTQGWMLEGGPGTNDASNWVLAKQGAGSVHFQNLNIGSLRWHIVKNSTTSSIYENGSYINQTDGTFNDLNGRVIGRRATQSLYSNAYIDELRWSTVERSDDWVSAEANELYSVGAEESSVTLLVNLTAPINNLNSTNSSINFSCSCIDTTACISLNMTIDGLVVQTVTNSTPNVNLSTSYFNSSIPDGDYTWFCSASSVVEDKNSSIYSFSVDTTKPSINLTAPQATYGTLLDGDPLNLNYSISDENLDACWYKYGTTETNQEYFTNGTNPRYLDLNNDGTYDLVTVEIVFGGNEIRLDDYLGSGLSNRSTTYPDCDTESYDVGGGSGNAKNWTTGDYFCVNTTNGDKIVIEMTSGNTPAYADFNVTVNAIQQIPLNCSASTTTFNYSAGINSINVFANDTFGNVNNQSRSWTILFTVNDIEFNTSSYETDYNSFLYNITFASTPLSISSILYYNNTNYISTSNCSGATCIITNNIDLPLVEDTSSNNSLYWEITIFNGTATSTYTSSTYYQSVSEINFSQCDATLNVTTLNYSAYDERDKSLLTPFEFAGDFEYYLGSGTVKKNLSLGNSSVNNYIDFCYSPSNRTLYLDSEIEYYKNDTTTTYKTRNYYTDNASLTNTSQDIFLYLLDEDFATSFILEVLDQSNDAVSSAFIYIQRCYVDTGNCETVQIAKTDENGKTLGFYEVETVDYKHLIYKDGELLLDQSKAKVFPEETPYTLIFRVGDAILYPWVYLVDNPSITISLSHNSTSNITSFSWIDASGSVSEGTLKVYQNLFNISDELICESSASFSSATVTCDLTGYDGSFVAYAYLDGEVVDIIRYSIDDNFSTFGNYGVMIGFFIILFVTLLFIWNPTAMVIMHNVATIFVWIIGFISFSPIYIFAMMGVSVLIIILLKT